MRLLIVVALASLLTALGAISAFYLVRGFREGRFALRLTFPLLQPPVSGKGEPGYAYRSHSPSLFWTEAAIQLSALVVCIATLIILISTL